MQGELAGGRGTGDREEQEAGRKLTTQRVPHYRYTTVNNTYLQFSFGNRK